MEARNDRTIKTMQFQVCEHRMKVIFRFSNKSTVFTFNPITAPRNRKERKREREREGGGGRVKRKQGRKMEDR